MNNTNCIHWLLQMEVSREAFGPKDVVLCLFAVNSTTLSVTQRVKHRMIERLINGEMDVRRRALKLIQMK